MDTDDNNTVNTWKMFKEYCLECGKEIYRYSKKTKQFCSRQCEKNNEYRDVRFSSSESYRRMSNKDVKVF